MTTERHTLRVGGHRLDVALDREGRQTVVALDLDGVQVARRSGWPLVRIPVDGIDEEKAAVLVTALRPGRGTVRLVVPAAHDLPSSRPEKLEFEPPAGTRAHRRHLWAQRHPRLYAARHVAVATGQVVLGLVLARIALGFVLRLDWDWLPDWRLPRIPRPDLPEIPWPDVPWPDIAWPDIDLPDWSLPGWLTAVLAAKKYWFPILVAVGVAVTEVRRRQRRRAEVDPHDGEQDEGKENAAWPGRSTPRSTSPGGSSSSTPDSPASRPTGTTARPPR